MYFLDEFTSVNQTTAFTDLCAFCKEPDYPFSWTIGKCRFI